MSRHTWALVSSSLEAVLVPSLKDVRRSVMEMVVAEIIELAGESVARASRHLSQDYPFWESTIGAFGSLPLLVHSPRPAPRDFNFQDLILIEGDRYLVLAGLHGLTGRLC